MSSMSRPLLDAIVIKGAKGLGTGIIKAEKCQPASGPRPAKAGKTRIYRGKRSWSEWLNLRGGTSWTMRLLIILHVITGG